jgi:hypothetical protein
MRTPALLLAALTLAGCSGGSSSPSPGSGTATGSGTAAALPSPPDAAPLPGPPDDASVDEDDAGPGDAGAAKGPTKVKVDVTAEGADPKYPLVYAAKAGTKQAMSMVVDATATMPGAHEMALPTLLADADVVVDSVDADGNLSVKVTFTKFDLDAGKDAPPDMTDEARAELAKLVGTGMDMRVASNGQVLALQVQGTTDPGLAQTIGQMQQALDYMMVNLPDKPVGKGAKWKTRQTITQQGVKVQQTVTYELLDVTATTAHIKATSSLSAKDQTMEQDGVKVKVEDFSGSAKVDLTIDFTKFAQATTCDIKMRETMTVASQTSDASLTTKMKITPK